MTHLSLGFSPCPNDTFIFHGLVHGAVEAEGLKFEPQLHDVETLNQLALRGELDVTKVSYGALPYLLEDYVLLRSGGALGRGCGPLVVTRPELAGTAVRGLRIAIPGRFTTAHLLLRLYAAATTRVVDMTYDRIMPAVASGEVDAGLIIHESRFTYPQHGLEKVVDLGEWWEEATGSAIPLGGIVARRELGEDIPGIEAAIRRSVELAFSNPSATAEYVRAHAQEMSEEVTRSHIDLYVNDFSVDLGPEGEHAVRELARRAAEAGLVPSAMDPLQR